MRKRVGESAASEQATDSLAGASCLYSSEGEWEERWTGDFIFENEWQSFRTKKDRTMEMTSVFHEYKPGRRKLVVKVVDIFGNDTMMIVEVNVEKEMTGREKAIPYKHDASR